MTLAEPRLARLPSRRGPMRRYEHPISLLRRLSLLSDRLVSQSVNAASDASCAPDFVRLRRSRPVYHTHVGLSSTAV